MRFRGELVGAVLLFAAAFAACGKSGRSRLGDDDTGGSGGGSFTGSGACTSIADCPRWACHCNDGSLVYAQSCNNGVCGQALDAGMCPAACAAFGGLASVDPVPDGGTSSGGGTASGGAAPPFDGGTSSGGGMSSGGAAPPFDGGSSSSGGAAPPFDGGP